MCSILAAARAGDGPAVAAALEADAGAAAETDKLSRTPLHLAAWAGHVSIVGLLCDAGADVSALAVDGVMPLHFAAQNGHEAVCKELIKRGARVNARDSKRQATALHLAAAKGHRDLIAYLESL